jgi:Cu-processing system ATP-binding protein
VIFTVFPAKGSAEAVASALPEAVHTGETLTIACPQAQKLALLSRLTALGAQVADIDVVPPSLEDIYSHFSKRDGQ